MVRPAILNDDAIGALRAELTDWTVIDDVRIRREFKFADFATAFGFMSACAIVAAELDHHPDWSNLYNRVVIELSTHDVDGLSELDLRFARRADALAASLGRTE